MFRYSLYSDDYDPVFLDNVVTALHSYFKFLLKSLSYEENSGILANDPRYEFFIILLHVNSWVYEYFEIILILRYPAVEKPSGVEIIERTISDFLAFLMLFVSMKKAGSHLLTEMWIKSLLEVLHVSDEGVPKINSLRPKLLTIQLLASILPEDQCYGVSKSSYIHIYDSEYKQQVKIF